VRVCHLGHIVCAGLSSRMLSRGWSSGILSSGMYCAVSLGLSSGMLYRGLSSGMLSCGTYSICGVVIWYVI